MFKAPKIETPAPITQPITQPSAPITTPVIGKDDELRKKKLARRKKVGTKQLQIPLGGNQEIGNRSGLGIPQG
jgi:hypothetical protein